MDAHMHYKAYKSHIFQHTVILIDFSMYKSIKWRKIIQDKPIMIQLYLTTIPFRGF